MIRNNSIFIHIPKNAGKWIEYVLKIEHRLSSKPKIRRIVRENAHVVFYHQDVSWLVKNHIVPEEFVKKSFIYTSVRNPFDRLVSAWIYFKFRKKRGFMDDIESFLEFSRISTKIDHTFDYKGRTLRGVGHIFRPQCRWLENLNVDFVIKFENLEEDTKKVADILGIEMREIYPLNTTEHKPYWEYYNDESIENVLNNYKEDFEFFGYEKELKNGLPDTS